MRRDAASIVANWPLWKQQIRLTKYSPEVDFGENKIMSVTAQEAFDKYYGQFDPDGPEWQDRSTQQIFIDGFNIANAQLAALKEENESLWETLLKIGIYLDIDFEWARKQPGKPSDVFIGKIGGIKARVAELENDLRRAVD